jgi:hypothetical protein
LLLDALQSEHPAGAVHAARLEAPARQVAALMQGR